MQTHILHALRLLERILPKAAHELKQRVQVTLRHFASTVYDIMTTVLVY